MRIATLVIVVCIISSMALASTNDNGLIPPNDPRIGVMGRVDATTPGRVRMGYPGVTLRVRFTGTSLAMRAETTTPDSLISVFVDGAGPRVVRLAKGLSDVVLAEQLPAGEHTVEILHRTETWVGIVSVVGFRVNGELLAAHPFPSRKMLFIGDSVSCGEAVERGPEWKSNRPASWNAYVSYGMRLARTFDAQVQLVCFGGRGLVRDYRGKRDVLNAPQLFDIALPDERTNPAWEHSLYTPDAVFISLGTNDFSLGIGDFPDREEWVSSYVKFLRAVRARFPKAQIFITEGAIVNDAVEPGKEPRPQKTILIEYLSETAKRVNDPMLHVVPSRHYPGDPSDAHPTAEQHAAMARDLEPYIRQAMGW